MPPSSTPRWVGDPRLVQSKWRFRQRHQNLCPTPLREGDAIGFGNADHRWTLADDSPPVAFAVCLEDGRQISGTASTLGLPDDDDPLTSVVRTSTGWIAETDQDGRPVEDRQVIEADGRWRLNLPLPGSHTTEAASLVHLDAANLRFVVSQDYEHIEIEVAHPAGPYRVPHYAANELLLVLAMARRDDEGSAAEHGWMHFDDLTASFRLTPMSPATKTASASGSTSAVVGSSSSASRTVNGSWSGAQGLARCAWAPRASRSCTVRNSA